MRKTIEIEIDCLETGVPFPADSRFRSDEPHRVHITALAVERRPDGTVDRSHEAAVHLAHDDFEHVGTAWIAEQICKLTARAVAGLVKAGAARTAREWITQPRKPPAP